MHYRFVVRTQSCTFAYILLGWLFCLAHRVEPITSSLCIRKTSFTGKTCYRHEVIISRKWIGPEKKNLVSLLLTFIIAVGVISNETEQMPQFH